MSGTDEMNTLADRIDEHDEHRDERSGSGGFDKCLVQNACDVFDGMHVPNYGTARGMLERANHERVSGGHRGNRLQNTGRSAPKAC